MSRRLRMNVVVRGEDFEFFAAALLTYWVRTDVDGDVMPVCIVVDDVMANELTSGLGEVLGFELDKLFVTSLRDIKTLVFTDREPVLLQLWQLAKAKLQTNPEVSALSPDLLSHTRKIRVLESRAFRSAAKGLVSIGAGLAQLKEFKGRGCVAQTKCVTWGDV